MVSGSPSARVCPAASARANPEKEPFKIFGKPSRAISRFWRRRGIQYLGHSSPEKRRGGYTGLLRKLLPARSIPPSSVGIDHSRHSGECRNPEQTGIPNRRTTKKNDKAKSQKQSPWIPACAGMTIKTPFTHRGVELPEEGGSTVAACVGYVHPRGCASQGQARGLGQVTTCPYKPSACRLSMRGYSTTPYAPPAIPSTPYSPPS